MKKIIYSVHYGEYEVVEDIPPLTGRDRALIQDTTSKKRSVVFLDHYFNAKEEVDAYHAETDPFEEPMVRACKKALNWLTGGKMYIKYHVSEESTLEALQRAVEVARSKMPHHTR